MGVLLDEEDRLAGPDKAERLRFLPGITWEFNAALFGFQVLVGFFQFAVVSGRLAKVSPVGLTGIFLTTGADALYHGLIALLAAWFVGEFWRRFACSAFKVRPIAYR